MTSVDTARGRCYVAAMPPVSESPAPTVIDCAAWAAFGLGSNLGDREAHLRRALDALETRFGPLRTAPPYVTAPVSSIPQDDYLNTVALVRLAELPDADATAERTVRGVVAFAKALEAAAGRRDGPRDGPRPLDVDLLFWGRLRLRLPPTDDTENAEDAKGGWPGAVTVPHPRLHERRFVLAPLADLAPRLRLPSGAIVTDLLAHTADQRAERVAWSDATTAGRKSTR